MYKIPIAKPYITEEEAKTVYKQIQSGWITMGKTVEKFEKQISDRLGVKYSLLVNNGTSAIHLCLMALDIQNGDEVIIPSISYIATANAVLYCNAKPVFVQEDERTFNLDAKSILKKITKKTKAIISTDLKGMPVDFDEISKVCKKNNIKFISDSAEAFGAKYKNNYVGSQALLHSFSFFGNKNITTGEGGLVTTNNQNLFKKLKVLRNQGQNYRYNHIMLGNNFRMNDITASFGIAQFKKLNKIINFKSRISKKYNKYFKDHKYIETPYIPKYVSQHGWYAYCIKLKNKKQRDLVIKQLQNDNIDYRISFPPIPLQPYYKKRFKYNKKNFKKSCDIFSRFIDLPNWYGMKDKEIIYVAKSVLKALNNYEI